MELAVRYVLKVVHHAYHGKILIVLLVCPDTINSKDVKANLKLGVLLIVDFSD